MSNKYQDDTLKIFSLNGNRPLAEKIAKVFGTELGKSVVKQFSDGEISSILKKVSVGIMCTSFNQRMHLSMTTTWNC